MMKHSPTKLPSDQSPARESSSEVAPCEYYIDEYEQFLFGNPNQQTPNNNASINAGQNNQLHKKSTGLRVIFAKEDSAHISGDSTTSDGSAKLPEEEPTHRRSASAGAKFGKMISMDALKNFVSPISSPAKPRQGSTGKSKRQSVTTGPDDTPIAAGPSNVMSLPSDVAASDVVVLKWLKNHGIEKNELQKLLQQKDNKMLPKNIEELERVLDHHEEMKKLHLLLEKVYDVEAARSQAQLEDTADRDQTVYVSLNHLPRNSRRLETEEHRHFMDHLFANREDHAPRGQFQDAGHPAHRVNPDLSKEPFLFKPSDKLKLLNQRRMLEEEAGPISGEANATCVLATKESSAGGNQEGGNRESRMLSESDGEDEFHSIHNVKSEVLEGMKQLIAMRRLQKEESSDGKQQPSPNQSPEAVTERLGGVRHTMPSAANGSPDVKPIGAYDGKPNVSVLTYRRGDHVYRKLSFSVRAVESSESCPMNDRDRLVSRASSSILSGEVTALFDSDDLEGIGSGQESRKAETPSTGSDYAIEETVEESSVDEQGLQSTADPLAFKKRDFGNVCVTSTPADPNMIILEQRVESYGKKMQDAVAALDFELAALYRELFNHARDVVDDYAEQRKYEAVHGKKKVNRWMAIA